MAETPLLDDSEVAALLGVTAARVRRLARRGLIPRVVLPNDEFRFDQADLREWIDGRKQPAEARR